MKGEGIQISLFKTTVYENGDKLEDIKMLTIETIIY